MLIVAKMIPYKPGPNRKLGLKRVNKDSSLEGEGQLNLFKAGHETANLKRIHHLDPFERALQIDGKNDHLAEKLYLEAVERSECKADAYCNLGILRARKGETAKAVQCFTLALKENPRHAEAHYNLANMFYDAGNIELAITHYEIAAEMDSFSEIHFNLALAYLSSSRTDEAKAALEIYLKSCSEPEAAEARPLLNLLNLNI